MHQNILDYKGRRYLTISVVLTLLCIGLYFSQGERQPANGGTWQGYVLGSLGAALILWLMALGIRKRSYRSTLGSLSAWVSAHVYLGSALLIIAALHCAFQFGLNIHTLAFVLMAIVILSGFFGLYAYIRYPRVASANRVNKARTALFEELSQINTNVRRLCKKCDGEIQRAVESAIDRTAIGGGVITQLFSLDGSQIVNPEGGKESSSKNDGALIANKDQQTVIDLVADKIPRARKQGQAALLQDILSMLCRRQALLRRIRKDIQLQGLMQVWLMVHIPFSIALLFALVGHIVAVFFYW